MRPWALAQWSTRNGPWGAWALAGMGAVVLDDVPPAEVWVGVPARRLRAVELPADLAIREPTSR